MIGNFCSNIYTGGRGLNVLSITVTIVSVSLFGIEQTSLAQGPGGGAPVIVAEVYDAEVHPTQEFVGTVMPERRAVVGSAVDGRVATYLAKEGERVESGAVLAKLLDETISKEIEAAEAELAYREQELRELQNGSLPEEKLQAAAMLTIAEAEQELAISEYQRIQRLFEGGRASSESELDQAKAQYQISTANIAERKAAKQLVDDGPREERVKRAEAQRDMQKAIVDKLKDQKRKHQMISRFAGYVVKEHTEEGEWVNRGSPVAEIAALDNIDVLVHVLESYVPYISIGMEVEVTISSLQTILHENGKPIMGEVVSIIPEADSRSRTFPVKVRVKNTIAEDGPVIKSGMLARVSLPVARKTKARLIPKDSLVLGGPTPVVWMMELNQDGQTGTVKNLPVKTGITSGSLIAIGEELKPGQLVISEGNERLRPGMPVQILGRREK